MLQSDGFTTVKWWRSMGLNGNKPQSLSAQENSRNIIVTVCSSLTYQSASTLNTDLFLHWDLSLWLARGWKKQLKRPRAQGVKMFKRTDPVFFISNKLNWSTKFETSNLCCRRSVNVESSESLFSFLSNSVPFVGIMYLSEKRLKSQGKCDKFPSRWKTSVGLDSCVLSCCGTACLEPDCQHLLTVQTMEMMLCWLLHWFSNSVKWGQYHGVTSKTCHHWRASQ